MSAPPTAALPIALYERLRNAQRCPNCPDQGWYVVANRNTGEPEQEQCEFCYTVSDSLFNVIESARASAVQATADADGATILEELQAIADNKVYAPSVKEELRAIIRKAVSPKAAQEHSQYCPRQIAPGAPCGCGLEEIAAVSGDKQEKERT